MTSFKVKQLIASELEHTILSDVKYINIMRIVKYVPANINSKLIYCRKTGLFTTVYKYPNDEEVVTIYNMEFLSLYLINVVNCLFIQTYSHGTAIWPMLEMQKTIRVPFINDEMQKKYIIMYNSFSKR